MLNIFRRLVVAKKNKKDNFTELCAGFGFLIGTIVWFLIYFSKDNLNYGKLVLFMVIGAFVGGIAGEVIQHYKKK